MYKKIFFLVLTLFMFYALVSTQVEKEPSLSITADTTTGMAPLNVNFTAAVNDPFGGIYPVTYEWYFDDNKASTGKNPKHTFDLAKTYNVVCRVTFWTSPKKTLEALIKIMVTEPIAVKNTPGTVDYIQITTDGAGGAFITWADKRSGSDDIYAQRVLADGTFTYESPGDESFKWTANGLAICTAGGNQLYPQITSDGDKGAIITWQDYRDSASSGSDIYVQRILGDGSFAWTGLNGLAICTAASDQSEPQITSDGDKGAIITWQDFRNNSNNDIYAQRILATGSFAWTDYPDNRAICTAGGNQVHPQITSDGEGGAFITWQDYRSSASSGSDIYVQRLLANGNFAWTGLDDGRAICTAGGNQLFPQIISDGAGGAIITWQDKRSSASSGSDIYAQWVLSDGSFKWTDSNGRAICTENGDQENHRITSDGAGGAFITWEDKRSSESGSDIYAQWVQSNGNFKWKDLNGRAICTAEGNQSKPQITSHGAGGAFITWEDKRSGSADIYAQRVLADGTFTYESPDYKSLKWIANGLAIFTADRDQLDPRITFDGAGGATITWIDCYSSSQKSIYALQVLADGSFKLPAK